MNPRHTNAIIELALLDNRQNRQTPAIQAQAKNLDPFDFARSFASIHLDLGRAAGHTDYAVRQWLNGAVLVTTGMERARLTKKHQVTAKQTRNLYDVSRWLDRERVLEPIGPELIIFDQGQHVPGQQTVLRSIFPVPHWPARYRSDHTYLFLG
ncbi:MAG: hypothetical protein VKI63_00145 [Cyanobium sp.]|nr:hypothetical protein [Cyanobium sp.]